ncbi:hypothetical protein GF345_01810 [Candidatus Woesearchaeota archaeon]|nr:hypothetical protein [Candidatus Woesearchaeota archaeon]
MSVLTPEKALKILDDAPEQHHFRLYMGTNIKNLKELAEALEIMADRSFSHHVSPTKNDFSSWIKEVVGDHQLADRVSGMESKKKMVKEIRKRVSSLEKRSSEHALLKTDYMKLGANDFAVGIVVGFIIGVVIAAVM